MGAGRHNAKRQAGIVQEDRWALCKRKADIVQGDRQDLFKKTGR
jgi:hypothetical protein